jgi:drug/metabolite transporter (DMT)-like permease
MTSAILLMLLCNAWWGVHPLLSKLLLEEVSPLESAWLRYTAGALTFWVFLGREWFRLAQSHWDRLRPKDLGVLLLFGLIPFGASPLLNYAGIFRAQSIDSAVMVAFEPVLTVVMAWMFLGESLVRRQLVGVGLATLGVLLIQIGHRLEGWEKGSTERGLGVSLIAVAILCEASFSILGRRLAGRFRVEWTFGVGISLGALVLSGVVWGLRPEGVSLYSVLSRLSRTGLLCVLGLGPIGTFLMYFTWLRLLRKVEVGRAALTLFLQPLLGMSLGLIARDEYFGVLAWIGVMVLMGGLTLAVVLQKRT